MSILSEDQKAEFHQNGVLFVENAVSPELLERLRADFAAVMRKPAP